MRNLPTGDGKANTDGVQMDEINWMQQNINAAQDATEKLQNTAKEIEKLKADPQKLKDYIKNVLNKDENTPLSSLSQEDHNKLANAASYDRDTQSLIDAKLDPDTMTPDQRSQALYDLQPIIHTPLDDLFGALGTIGGGLLGSLGLALGRRREDEEGSERYTKVDGDKIPVPDSINDPVALANPDAPSEPERRPDATVLSPLERGEVSNLYNSESKMNKLMEGLTGKSPSEIKQFLSNLSPSEINQLAKESKNVSGKLTDDNNLVITKSEKTSYKEKEIDSKKEADVRKINDKVESFVNDRFLKNYSDTLDAHNENYNSAYEKYKDTIAKSELYHLMGEPLKTLGADDPLRKILESSRESWIKQSEFMLNSATPTFLGTVKPTVDQLIAASKKMEDYKTGKIKNIDAVTAKLIGHQLVLDKEFAAIAQPQNLKDSHANLLKKKSAAEKGFAEALKNFENNKITQQELTNTLTKLEADYTNALKYHKDNWIKYEKDVVKMIQTRDPDRNITIASLDKITANIVVDGPIKYKEVTAKYKVLTDEAGNFKLVSTGDAAMLERADQKRQFGETISNLPKDFSIKIADSGNILTGVDGKSINMSPGDADRRREALDKIKETMGKDFDSTNNPNFAKLEAIGNFAQKTDKDGNPLFKGTSPIYTTSVNGIKIEFIGDHDVSPESSIVKADGANWMKLSEAARVSGVTEIGLTSVVRDKADSHGGGYSMDVGSIKDLKGKEILIKYSHKDFDFSNKQINFFIEASTPLDSFLDHTTSQSSNLYSKNPYFMVNGAGVKIPNFFAAVPSTMWEQKTDFRGLQPAELKKEIAKYMREAAVGYDPNLVLSDDEVEQMWNHRHHLHVTEVNK